MESLQGLTAPSPTELPPAALIPTGQSPLPIRTREAGEAAPVSSRRILIVEDDVSLANFLWAEFRAQKYIPEMVHDGEEALAMLQSQERFDLLILDLNLPKLDGMSLLDQVRLSYPRLRLLVLTARNRIEDKVAALQRGADDCVIKPFSLLELLARTQALLRRNSGMVPNCSRIGDLVVDRDQRRVERNGKRIELTPREFAILECLTRYPGKAVSRATLLEEVWNSSGEPATNIVDVYMKYVRDKVDQAGGPRLIHTVRGFGYEVRAS